MLPDRSGPQPPFHTETPRGDAGQLRESFGGSSRASASQPPAAAPFGRDDQLPLRHTARVMRPASTCPYGRDDVAPPAPPRVPTAPYPYARCASSAASVAPPARRRSRRARCRPYEQGAGGTLRSARPASPERWARGEALHLTSPCADQRADQGSLTRSSSRPERRSPAAAPRQGFPEGALRGCCAPCCACCRVPTDAARAGEAGDSEQLLTRYLPPAERAGSPKRGRAQLEAERGALMATARTQERSHAASPEDRYPFSLNTARRYGARSTPQASQDGAVHNAHAAPSGDQDEAAALLAKYGAFDSRGTSGASDARACRSTYESSYAGSSRPRTAASGYGASATAPFATTPAPRAAWAAQEMPVKRFPWHA